MRLPSVGGTTATGLIIAVIVIAVSLIIAITVITIAGDTVPPTILAALTLLLGILAGSRITTPDVQAKILDETKGKDTPV